MTGCRRIVPGLAAILAFALIGPALTQQVKPLSEADVLKLVELQIDEDAIIQRLKKGGPVAFKVDEAVLQRLKGAGASERVLAFLQGKDPDAAAQAGLGKMMVLVERYLSSVESPLHSEFSINGKLVETFTSDTYKPIEQHLKAGWNTITIKTTPQPLVNGNLLYLRVGPMRKNPANDRMEMGPVLWRFNNETDWLRKDGKWAHRLGPDVKSVTLNYKLYWAGLEREDRKPKKGDYVLHGHSYLDSPLTPVSATVFVNGTPLNSFVSGKREIVITPLLKQGQNEIKLVTHRTADVVFDNDIYLDVAGPAEYSVAKGRFLLKQILQLNALAGWERSEKNGQLVNKAKPGEDSLERVVTFMLDEAPK